jgi:hypothetical protein
MLVTDRWPGYTWDYYLSDRKAPTIIAAFKHLFGMLKRLTHRQNPRLQATRIRHGETRFFALQAIPDHGNVVKYVRSWQSLMKPREHGEKHKGPMTLIRTTVNKDHAIAPKVSKRLVQGWGEYVYAVLCQDPGMGRLAATPAGAAPSAQSH